VDSSYLVYLAWKHKLKPLVVHFDNGWNSETAVRNIERMIVKTGFDYQCLVIDWEEFRDLQRSFFRAGVIDIELLTDHAIMATTLRLARKHNIPCVLSGTNHATEYGMPKGWNWFKQDLRNIRDIHRKFGEKKLSTFPRMSLWETLWRLRVIRKPKFLEPLNMMAYRKDEAIRTLEQEFGWQYYGGKHFESVFTKFYQAYVLPKKFGVDKRKVHLSALIRNGEITRDLALAELAKPHYPPEDFERDRDYVLKKLGFSLEEFDKIMAASPIPHDHYASDRKTLDSFIKLKRALT